VTGVGKAVIGVLCLGPIARGAASSVAIRVTSLGLGFVQAIFTARLLGPEGYGVVAVALSVTAIAASVAMLGFGPSAVREVAQLAERSDWARLRGFLKFSSLSVLAVSSIVGVTIALLAMATPLFGSDFRITIAAATPLVPLLALLAVFRGQSQGFGRVIAAQTAGELVRPCVIVTSLAALLLIGSIVSTLDYVAIAILATLIGAVAAKFMLQRIVAEKVPLLRALMAPRYWSRRAAPFLGITLLGVIGTEASTLMLGWISGPTEAGLFQPVARIMPVLIIASEAISIPLAPRLAQLWERGDLESIRQISRKATMAATCGTIGLAIAILLVAPIVLSAFGQAFLINQHLLVWIALAQIFNASFGMAALLLAMTGRMKLRLLAQGATLVVQIGAGLLLIGPFGAAGAAAALAAAVVTWALTHWLIVRKVLCVETSLFSFVRL
jgi:O-antigen/teichoic acid export membrane protein